MNLKKKKSLSLLHLFIWLPYYNTIEKSDDISNKTVEIW